MKAAQARSGIDVERGDQLRRVGRDLLDVDAAFGGSDEGHAARGAVDEERQIKLAGDGRVLDHIDAAHDAALRPGLRRDERLAQHAVGFGVQLLERLHELDAAALAASAGMDLRLHHKDVAAEILRLRGGVLCRRGDRALGHRRAVGLEQFLGLVLVNIHGNSLTQPSD